MKLKNQVAVVTGAGRNIGEEIAKLFAAEGAKVAIVDMDKPRGERVASAIRSGLRPGIVPMTFTILMTPAGVIASKGCSR